MTPALSVENLSFAYGAIPTLESISFSVGRGKLCGLLGANGSGKSTLFKCCLNFLKPSGGRILLQGEESLHRPPHWIAKRLAYVPQESGFSFPFSGLELVLMGRSPHMGGVFGLSQEDYRKACEAMERVGIESLAEAKSSELSGGQRQLLLIARALAQEAEVMILDEPTSALDFRNQIRLWRLLRDIADSGTTVIVCSHEPNHVLWFADEALALARGRLIAHGKAQEVLQGRFLEEIYGEECELYPWGNRHFIAPARL